MDRRVAIVQSNYIPWKGYFDLIASVDAFVLYDDVQFTKNDWRNRNRIKTDRGLEWLSVPVGQDIRREIREVQIPDSKWQQKHWATLQTNYGRAPHFRKCAEWLRPIYLETVHENLSDLNRRLIEAICSFLAIGTPLHWSWDFPSGEGKTDRLVEICHLLQAAKYVSGPAAKAYLDCDRFLRRGIEVTWFDYSGYLEYPQLGAPFEHAVSILDLLFHCGQDSGRFMKHVR